MNREDFNNDRVDPATWAPATRYGDLRNHAGGSRGRMVDDLRYGGDARIGTPAPRGRGNEYGFLKIRYKLPGSSESQLLEQPIAVNAGVPRALRQDVEFATAVAGFAQLLQGGRYTGTLTYEDVAALAQRAIGADPNGHRDGFVQLVQRAQDTLGR